MDVVFCPLVVDGVPDAFKFFDLNLVVFCLLNQIIGKAALSYIIKSMTHILIACANRGQNLINPSETHNALIIEAHGH